MSQRRIEYLDLSIRIPQHLLKLVVKWVEQFTEEGEEIVSPPKVKAGHLRINSQDLIQFLGFVNPEELSDIDLQRLKTLAKEQLQIGLGKSVHPEFRYHYQWCLAALESFELGRFVDAVRPSGSEGSQ